MPGGGAPGAGAEGAPTSRRGWLASLVAGPVAGVASRFIIYPSDTIKARLQVQGTLPGRSLYAGTLDAALQMVRHEGPRAFYHGFGAVVVGNVPANMAYFGGYELGKWVMPEGSGLAGSMVAGASAQLVGGFLFTPIDIIKERMQVQGIMPSQLPYKGSWHALQSLLKDRGLFGLFRGYWATNAVWIPWSILHIAAFEQFKGWAAQSQLEGSNRQPEDLPPWVLGWCSAASASLASLATHPADVVKTRLQVMNATASGARPTALTVAQQALKQEGARVFMSGALARVLTLAPGSALSWMIYEPVKRAVQGL